jgi:hypothetical protein
VSLVALQKSSKMSLWQWFMTVDTDRSGHINSAELQRALAMGNLNFSLAICQQMIRSVLRRCLPLPPFCLAICLSGCLARDEHTGLPGVVQFYTAHMRGQEWS